MCQKSIDTSIIIPLYNSGVRISQLYQNLTNILPSCGNYEIIFVDDGSKDNAIEIIKEIKRQNQRVRILQLEKNMGQYKALYVGYKCSKGKIVISLDDDAFEEVYYIPEFIKKIEEGFDIVLGWRKKNGYPFLRKIASLLFNVIISLIIRRRIHDIGSSLKAKSRKTADKLISLGELSHFLKYYKYYKLTELRIPYNYSKQLPTRYSVIRLIKGALLILKNNIFNKTEHGQTPIENYIEIN